MSNDHPNSKPLAGLRILVTRARSQAAALSDRLVELGASVVELPAIEIVPLPLAALDTALSRVTEYDWVLFTSTNAVDIVFDRVESLGLELSSLAGVRLATIGSSTADRVNSRGLAVSFVPERAIAESMLDGLVRLGLSGARILLPRARVARNTLPDGLRAAGARVDIVEVYETRATAGDEDAIDDVRALGADWVTFTSQSSVRNTLAALGGRVPEGARIACIGPITAEAAHSAGLTVDILASEHSVSGLADALVAEVGTPGEGTQT
ncbi:MAG TPA: uroporphyrinogen-III synthase [Thermomicrobiales bacterium]|nr:uroporphyrinogen-III synthase [Thermomicrobiales bacterium]